MNRPTTSPGRTLRALRHRNFRLFFFGMLVSLVGSWMQSLAQGWLVWRLSESYFLLGVVNFCQFAPVLLLGLLGGVAADRFDRHRVVLVTQAAMLVQASALTALTFSGAIEVWHILALAMALGTINAFDMPGRQSLLAQLVPREDLGNAIALNSSVFNGARIVGPALAGFVVQHWGEAACFGANAVSYLAVLGSLLLIRAPSPRALPGGPVLRHLRDGFVYACSTPHVRSLLGLMAFTGFFGSSYLSFLPAYATDVLGSDARGLGWLMSAAGAGALSAAILMARRQGIGGLGTVVPLTAIGFGGTLVGFASAPHLAIACLLIAIIGFFMMTQMASTNTLLQALVPDHLRGRLMSLYTMTLIGMAPVGSLALGRMAGAWGLRPVLAGGGFVLLAAGMSFARPLARAIAAARPPAPSPVG